MSLTAQEGEFLHLNFLLTVKGKKEARKREERGNKEGRRRKRRRGRKRIRGVETREGTKGRRRERMSSRILSACMKRR